MTILLSMGLGWLLDKSPRFFYFIGGFKRMLLLRAVSSAVEYRPYKPGVTGSNPVPPTIPIFPFSSESITTVFQSLSARCPEGTKKGGR
jgi:hypothetical protein